MSAPITGLSVPQCAAVDCAITQAAGAKAMGALLAAQPSLVAPTAIALLRPLAACALEESSSSSGPVREPPKTVYYETPHPYNNDMRWEQAVEVKGATALLISFDPQVQQQAQCSILIAVACNGLA
jgi:hypothetical protein